MTRLTALAAKAMPNRLLLPLVRSVMNVRVPRGPE
jgi:hypothetical protein